MGSFGKPLLVGDLSSSRILGVIPLDDPLALFERLCAGIIPTASAAIGALLITLFMVCLVHVPSVVGFVP